MMRYARIPWIPVLPWYDVRSNSHLSPGEIMAAKHMGPKSASAGRHREGPENKRKPLKPEDIDTKGEVKAPLWRRPVIWLGGVASALVIAAATAIGTGIGSTVWSKATAPGAPVGPPVRIEAVSPLQFGTHASYVLPQKLILTTAELASMNIETGISTAGYVTWFQRRGAVQAGEGIISITIASNSSSAVTIKQLSVIKRCQGPLQGTLFDDFLGAGPQTTPEIAFNLDQQVSIGQFAPAAGPDQPKAGGNFFEKEIITVSPQEPPQTLILHAYTNHRFCQFTFQMQVATPHGIATESITNNGMPFQLTSLESDSFFKAVYQSDNGKFALIKPRS